jgi:hypothetical protein
MPGSQPTLTFDGICSRIQKWKRTKMEEDKNGRGHSNPRAGSLPVTGGQRLLLSRLFLFKENRNNRSCSWYYRFVTTGIAMPGWTAIYDPPNEGLP